MIRCERLSVERSGQLVVDRLSLEVPSGTALAVIGRGGAGKSSLLAALATAIPIHGGDASIAGVSAGREPAAARSHLGYAPARLDAWPAARAADLLELFAVAAGLGAEPARRAIAKALDLAGVAGSARVGRLADGAAKRLLVARALLHDPEVLLLDDPFAGLDPHERGDVERLIGDTTLRGRTVVAAIDDAVVPDCFTHLAVLAGGRLTAEGPASPAAFSAGRSWRHRFICRGRSDRAAELLRPLAADVELVDADTVACGVDPAAVPAARLVAALVQAGLDLESAACHPYWTVQLLDA